MSEPTMANKFFLIELRDSDGNDCTVYDVLIEAKDDEEAYAILDKYIEEEYPGDESDGSFGTFHPCVCECEHGTKSEPLCEECSEDRECSHGGLLYGETGYQGFEAFDTYEQAYEARARYHTLIDLTEVQA